MLLHYGGLLLAYGCREFQLKFAHAPCDSKLETRKKRKYSHKSLTI